MRKNNFNTLKNVFGVVFCFIQSERKQSFGEWVSMNWVGQGSLVWNNQAFGNRQQSLRWVLPCGGGSPSAWGCTSHLQRKSALTQGCTGGAPRFPSQLPTPEPCAGQPWKQGPRPGTRKILLGVHLCFCKPCYIWKGMKV